MRPLKEDTGPGTSHDHLLLLNQQVTLSLLDPRKSRQGIPNLMKHFTVFHGKAEVGEGVEGTHHHFC